jgi:hypothetical protein
LPAVAPSEGMAQEGDREYSPNHSVNKTNTDTRHLRTLRSTLLRLLQRKITLAYGGSYASAFGESIRMTGPKKKMKKKKKMMMKMKMKKFTRAQACATSHHPAIRQPRRATTKS